MSELHLLSTKEQGGKARHFLIDIFSAMSGKKKKEKQSKFYFRKMLCLAQILSLDVVLTFCGFRTLMTCVMVPVLNAGTMLLLTEAAAGSSGVEGRQRASSEKYLILCQRCQQVKSDTQMMVQLTDIPNTKFYLFFPDNQQFSACRLSLHDIYKTLLFLATSHLLLSGRSNFSEHFSKVNKSCSSSLTE